MAGALEYELQIKIDNIGRKIDDAVNTIERKLDDGGKKGGKRAGKEAAQAFNTSFKANFAADLVSDLVQEGVAVIQDQVLGSFSLAMDFEQQISAISALGGVSSEVKSQVEQLAFDLGSSTKFSALEAAQGMEELLKAGLNIDQIMTGGAQGALDLAAAGSLEVADAAEIASVALNTFRSDNLSVARAADILAGGANASATSVQELKFGLSQAAVNAANVGLSFEDTATTLSLFANNGLKGSDAGTSLKTMLLRLQPTTEKTEALFGELGLQFFNAEGQMKSMAEVADILRDKLGGMTDEQRQLTLFELFGSDAIRGANILFKEGGEGIEKMNKEMNKFTAQEVAAEKTNNMAGAWERFMAAVDTIKIQAIQGLFPIITPLVDEFGKSLGQLDFEDIKNFFTDPVVQTGMVSIATFIGVLIVGAILKMIAAFAAFSIAFAASPFGAMALLISGIVTALKVLDEEGVIHLEDFKTAALSVFDGIKWAVDGVGNAINGLIGLFDAATRSVGNLVGASGKVKAPSDSFFGKANSNIDRLTGQKDAAEERKQTIEGIKTIRNFRIPGFATGTSFAPGGLAMVGERGPELLKLPRGSEVLTKEKTENTITNSIGSYNTVNNYGGGFSSLSSQIGYQS